MSNQCFFCVCKRTLSPSSVYIYTSTLYTCMYYWSNTHALSKVGKRARRAEEVGGRGTKQVKYLNLLHFRMVLWTWCSSALLAPEARPGQARLAVSVLKAYQPLPISSPVLWLMGTTCVPCTLGCVVLTSTSLSISPSQALLRMGSPTPHR
jgi:hypothetical protein